MAWDRFERIGDRPGVCRELRISEPGFGPHQSHEFAEVGMLLDFG
jgi:hypothetical protein